MSGEKKDASREVPKKNPTVEVSAGVLKEKDKTDLENRLTETLKNLNSRLTKKEILSLIHRIEVGKGLEWLRSELEKEKKLEGTKISDELLQDILNLFREVEQIAESGLKELKLELSALNESKEYTVDKAIYLTNRFPWIKRLEQSKLGENIIIDLAGIATGSIDSIHAILKFLLTLLEDVILLPKQIVEEMRKR